MGLADSVFQARVQLATEGFRIDLEPLRAWLLRPLDPGASIDSLCSGNRAEAIVVEGIRYCLRMRSDPFVRELIARYFVYASAVILNPGQISDFVAPLWLCWIRDTARSLETWASCSVRLPESLQPAFRAAFWAAGLKYIASGFPLAANNLWERSVCQLIAEQDAAGRKLLKARDEFRECIVMADELELPPPLIEFPDDAEQLLIVVQEWRTTALQARMDELFWNAHCSFLESTRHRASPFLSKQRKRKLSQLINSAQRRASPEISEIKELCSAYGDVMDELIGATNRIENGQP